MTAERMLRVILSECNKAPALFDCSRESFLGAILQCSALGLEPGSALGHCYLIPYGKTCQLIIGYRGMIENYLKPQLGEINPAAKADGTRYSAVLHLADGRERAVTEYGHQAS